MRNWRIFWTNPQEHRQNDKTYARKLSRQLQSQLDAQLVLADATTALVENGLRCGTEDQVTAFDIILRTYLSRLSDISSAQINQDGEFTCKSYQPSTDAELGISRVR